MHLLADHHDFDSYNCVERFANFLHTNNHCDHGFPWFAIIHPVILTIMNRILRQAMILILRK